MKHRLVSVIVIASAAAPAIATAGARRARSVDVNGDGLADLVASEPEDGGSRGRLHVYFGAAGGPAAVPDQTFGGSSADPALHVVDLHGLGDVDGDGFGDVLAISDAGASLYVGSAAGLVTSPATILRTPDGETTGVAFAALGDVNGDGLDDLGATVDCRQQPVFEVVPPEPAGIPLSGAGSAPTVSTCRTAQVHFYVWFGAKHGLSAAPDQAFDAPQDLDAMLARMTGAGDVDGDGFADVIRCESGGARLYRGGKAGVAATPTGPALAPRAMIVERVASAGDVDGDGHADVVAIAISASADRTAALLYRGGRRGLVARPAGTFSVLGGFSGAGVGDLDGDGRGDLALGETGAVSVRRGSATGVRRRAMLMSPSSPAGNFGTADVGSPGDLDGDGRADLVVAAPFSGGPINQDNFGAAFVLRGGHLDAPADRLTGLGGALEGDFATAIAFAPP